MVFRELTGARLQRRVRPRTAAPREFASTCSSVSNAPRGRILARELRRTAPLPRDSLIVWSSETGHCNVSHRRQNAADSSRDLRWLDDVLAIRWHGSSQDWCRSVGGQWSSLAKFFVLDRCIIPRLRGHDERGKHLIFMIVSRQKRSRAIGDILRWRRHVFEIAKKGLVIRERPGRGALTSGPLDHLPPLFPPPQSPSVSLSLSLLHPLAPSSSFSRSVKVSDARACFSSFFSLFPYFLTASRSFSSSLPKVSTTTKVQGDEM